MKDTQAPAQSRAKTRVSRLDLDVVFVVFGSFSLDLGLSETRGPMRETKKKCGSWHGKSLRLETKFKKYKNTNYGSNVSMDRQSLQSCLFANKKK